jgi:hypothetical protein
MSKADNVGVALLKRACRVCQETVDAEIIMNKELTGPRKENVEAMHGKIVGWIDSNPLGMCPNCMKAAKKGVFLITVDEEKTGEDIGNPYRTGGIFCLKEKAIKEIFGQIPEELDRVLEKRAAFIPDEIARMIGLPMDYLDGSGQSN